MSSRELSESEIEQIKSKLDSIGCTKDDIADIINNVVGREEINDSIYSIDKNNISKNIRNLKVGDKVTIGTLDAYVAGINWEPGISDYHVSLIANFGDCIMGNSAIHGYAGAKDMQNFLNRKAEGLRDMLGDHLVEREVMLSTGIDDSTDEDRTFEVSSYDLFKKYLTLLSEVEVFGKREYSKEYEIHDKKYPIFENTPIENIFRTNVWLRGVYSSAGFCGVAGGGSPGIHDASYSRAAVALFVIR